MSRRRLRSNIRLRPTVRQFRRPARWLLPLWSPYHGRFLTWWDDEHWLPVAKAWVHRKARRWLRERLVRRA